jgi:hypothetical protein
MFCNIIRFYCDQLLAPRSNPMPEDHPLSYIVPSMYSQPPSTFGGRSSIRKPRTRHAVVTGTHLIWIQFIKDVWNVSAKQNPLCSSDELYLSNHVTAVNISGCNVCCVDFHCLTVSNISSKTPQFCICILELQKYSFTTANL